MKRNGSLLGNKRLTESTLPEEDGEGDGEVDQNSLQEWGSAGWQRGKHHKDTVQCIKQPDEKQLPLRKQDIILHGDEHKDLPPSNLVPNELHHHQNCSDTSKEHHETQRGKAHDKEGVHRCGARAIAGVVAPLSVERQVAGVSGGIGAVWVMQCSSGSCPEWQGGVLSHLPDDGDGGEEDIKDQQHPRVFEKFRESHSCTYSTGTLA